MLESESIPKSAHDANFGMTVLARHGVTVRNVNFDPMIAAHVGGRKAVGIEALALESLDIELKPVTDIIGTGRKQITMAQASIGDASAPRVCVRADATWQLRDSLTEESVQKGVAGALGEFEMPLIPVLVRMQRTGVAVDVDHLGAMSDRFERDIERTEAGMFELVGHEFNIGSSQQLGGVLFDELRLPPTKKRKTGYATDAQSLEWLRQMISLGQADGVDPKAVEVLDRVLEYRQLTKIKSTYLDSLPGQVNPATGRVHTMYHQTGSATGRVSSNDPNVQNIPIRTEMGREVRQAFVAQDAPAWTLLGADYSQIELRILAELSRDDGLIEAFESGQDIHAATASSVYGVGIDEVDSEMRRIAKIMNFGVIYGLSPFGMSQQTGLSPEEGKTFIDAYFGKYPGIESYIDGIKRSVKDTRLRRDAEGTAALHPRDSLAQLPPALGGRAHGHQHAHPGDGGRHPEAGDGASAGRDGHAGAAVDDDPAGARRAHIRVAAGGAGRDEGTRGRGNARSHDPGGPAGGRREDGRQLGRHGLRP